MTLETTADTTSKSADYECHVPIWKNGQFTTL
jgi:hypothetical protein